MEYRLQVVQLTFLKLTKTMEKTAQSSQMLLEAFFMYQIASAIVFSKVYLIWKWQKLKLELVFVFLFVRCYEIIKILIL